MLYTCYTRDQKRIRGPSINIGLAPQTCIHLSPGCDNLLQCHSTPLLQGQFYDGVKVKVRVKVKVNVKVKVKVRVKAVTPV